MILYRSSLTNYYYLVLVIGGWLLYKSKNFQNMGGFYRSATIWYLRLCVHTCTKYWLILWAFRNTYRLCNYCTVKLSIVRVCMYRTYHWGPNSSLQPTNQPYAIYTTGCMYNYLTSSFPCPNPPPSLPPPHHPSNPLGSKCIPGKKKKKKKNQPSY